MSNLAIRPMDSEDQDALLRAILSATDYGVMLTDLDHVTIACNRRFGEIFSVDIDSVVHSTAAEVRQMVAPLIADIEAWSNGLEDVYANPMQCQEDELVLAYDTPMAIRRYTGPVLDHNGQVSGRLWTFLDVTEESRRRAIREALYEVSTFFDETPRAVYQAIVERLASHYGSNSVLSILDGETLEFRVVASDIPDLRHAKGNTLRDSYCQFALEKAGPFCVQDARTDKRTCELLPARFGLTRYAGAPIKEPSGRLIGTLCILDNFSDRTIDDNDLQFLSLLAMRVGAELAREAYMADRIAEKQAVVEAQKADLDATRQVLAAMNRAFELLGNSMSLDKLVQSQVKALKGILDYEGVGLFVGIEGSAEFSGWLARCGAKKLEKVARVDSINLARSFAPDHALVVPLRRLPGHEAHLVFSSQINRQGGEHHDAHLEALVEQVSLLISSHLLQQQLASAYRELKSAHERLVQSEKLSVVGTLAASTAHDIKNILSSITLELGLGLEDPERALSAVKGHLDRFSVLAHRLLSYARPRLVAMQPFCLSEVVQRVVALTAAHTRVTDVTVVIEISDSVPRVLGDPHQIEHLLVNLVLNAVQAMHESGGTLRISAESEKSVVKVAVSDTGRGLSQDAADRLFEPFASTRTEGFGLGLYSCRRIIEEHGGEIKVKSRAEKGTTFSVTMRSAEVVA